MNACAEGAVCAVEEHYAECACSAWHVSMNMSTGMFHMLCVGQKKMQRQIAVLPVIGRAASVMGTCCSDGLHHRVLRLMPKLCPN